MEKEKFHIKDNCKESVLYHSLLETPVEDFDNHLDYLAREVVFEDEVEVLDKLSVLLSFVCNKEIPSVNKKIVDFAVENVVPVLNCGDAKKIDELLAKEYRIVLNNLEEIQETVLDESVKEKCTLGMELLDLTRTQDRMY